MYLCCRVVGMVCNSVFVVFVNKQRMVSCAFHSGGMLENVIGGAFGPGPFNAVRGGVAYAVILAPVVVGRISQVVSALFFYDARTLVYKSVRKEGIFFPFLTDTQALLHGFRLD